MVLSRVRVWSVARMLGALYAVLGLLAGMVVALAAMLGAGLVGTAATGPGGVEAPGALLGVIFGVGAIVFLPLLYGVMGLVFGALAAALYNVFAGILGGIEIELQTPSVAP